MYNESHLGIDGFKLQLALLLLPFGAAGGGACTASELADYALVSLLFEPLALCDVRCDQFNGVGLVVGFLQGEVAVFL